ncbi:MAG: hypothetical protein SFV54_14840 [Bryobacteraceae bacterium]|nr:hypothetical protein [Bryobacteraceae bacterium]
MLRLSLGVLALAAASFGAVLPERVGTATKTPGAPVETPGAFESEVGLVEAEQAGYGRLTVSAWKFKDSTGAYSFYLARRGAGGQWQQAGNYVLCFEGGRLRGADLEALIKGLPGRTDDPLPTLPGFLPEQSKVAGSEQFVIGPAGLAASEPRLDASLALFDLGTEVQLAAYEGGVTLALMAFPTPQIARQRLPEIEKVPGATVRRSGPLVAVAFGTPAAATAIADAVKYEASVSWNQPTKDYFSGNVADMLIGIFKLTGYILVFCIGAGLFVLGMRRLGRWLSGSPNAVEPMIVLDLKDK